MDSWSRPKPQPVHLSLYLKTSVALAGSTDHLPYSIHYGHVCKSVTNLVTTSTFSSLEHLAESIARLALGEELHGEWVQVIVEKPRALLRADAAGISIVRRKKKVDDTGFQTFVGGVEVEAGREDRVFIKGLRLVTVIGVNPWEREEAQNVTVNLTLHKPTPTTALTDSGAAPPFDPAYDFRTVVKAVSSYVEKSTYKTVEALVTSVALVACRKCGIEKVTVSVEKPSALTFADCAGVEITRHRSFFDQFNEEVREDGGADTKDSGTGVHRAFIAVGSNVGDRFNMIRGALKEMDKRGLKVKKTSSLYESEPMYVLDQPKFLNGACEVSP